MKSYALKTICLVSLILVVLTANGVAQRQSRNETAVRFRKQINAISKGIDSSERGKAVIKRLEELGISHRFEKFTHKGKNGANIIAELDNKRTRKLLLGAHYDRTASGRGAVDNASGVAVVLELLARLKAKPLKNYSVSAVLFDLHEAGLFGATEYVASRQREQLPALFINFDTFGYGDALWVMTTDKSSELSNAVEKAAKKNKISIQTGTDYPMTDHIVFTKAKIETLSFSLLPKEEIHQFIELFNAKPDEMQAKVKPKVLSIIHTDEDKPEMVDEKAAVKGIDAVERAIRIIDETYR